MQRRVPAARLADKRLKTRNLLILQTRGNENAQLQLSKLKMDGAAAINGELAFEQLREFFMPQQAAIANAKVVELDAATANVFKENETKVMLERLILVEKLYNDTIHGTQVAKLFSGITADCNAELVAYKVQWRQDVNNGTITEFRDLLRTVRVELLTMIAEGGNSNFKALRAL